MNILLKRLIGLGVAVAALVIIGITHSAAYQTYIEDRKSIEEEKNRSGSEDA